MALPGSGSLMIKTAAGAGRSIAQEVDGNTIGNKSLATLSSTAGKIAPHSMLEFYNYDGGIVVAPGPPSSVTAFNVEPDVVVTWNAPVTGDPPTLYRIDRREDGGPWGLLDTTTNTSYSDTTTSSSHTYRYRVRAENSGGVSAFVESNDISK